MRWLALTVVGITWVWLIIMALNTDNMIQFFFYLILMFGCAWTSAKVIEME